MSLTQPKKSVRKNGLFVLTHSLWFVFRCKLFYKKGKEFADKGLGMCHLKKVEGKAQMIVRCVATNLLALFQVNFVQKSTQL